MNRDGRGTETETADSTYAPADAGDPVIYVHHLGTKRLFRLDDFRFEGAPKSSISVGRDPGCDIVIDHPAVSRHHCLVRRIGDVTFIQDDSSKNQTTVNKIPLVKGRARIHPGAIIHLGADVLLAACGVDGIRQKLDLTVRDLDELVIDSKRCYGTQSKAADALSTEALSMEPSKFSRWLSRIRKNKGDK